MNDPHTTSPNTSPPIAGVPAAVREVWSEFYTDEEMDAMGDALIREDVVEAARRLRAYHAQQRAAADGLRSCLANASHRRRNAHLKRCGPRSSTCYTTAIRAGFRPAAISRSRSPRPRFRSDPPSASTFII